MNGLVLGAGLMGSQIACEYAIGGHTDFAASRDPTTLHHRLDPTLDLAERLGKIAVLRPVAQRYPEAVIATNTSSLSITRIGDEIGAEERAIGTHYWNPPLLMPLVEIVAGDRTRPDVVDRVREMLVGLGKDPVLVARDVPGFVWNRLQLAVMREALWLADNGVVSPSDLDTIVRDGLGRRWRLVGPFETAALGGADTCRRIGENLLPELSDAHDLAGLERWLLIDQSTLTDVRRLRDESLAAELISERRSSTVNQPGSNR